jgi:putative Holliday junction resolvase
MKEDTGRIMGLDFGGSRIGLALSDPLGIMATPLTIITRTDKEKDIDAIVGIIRQNGVGRVVMGLPISMDGSFGQQVEKVRDFAAELSKKINIPIEFQDERLSTVVAKNLVREARKTDRKTRYDAAAAALILQSYLDDTATMRRNQGGSDENPG